MLRSVTLCAARGRFPIRFNGSLFTVDWNVEHDNGYHESYNADFRRWSNFIFVQNVRWAYWCMLSSGDAEHMKVLFRVYIDSLESARLRCQKYFGFDGIHYQDSITDWGVAMGLAVNGNASMETYIRDAWSANYVSSVLEILLMALDYFDFTGDESVLVELATPGTVLMARFYLNKCATDERGKILIESSALEQYHKTVNPMPDVAGLQMVLGKWLALGRGSPEERAEVAGLLVKLPELPMGKVLDEYEQMADRRESRWDYIGVPLERPPKIGAADDPAFAPAEKVLTGGWNIENPELYAIFPYRRHFLLNGDLELARRSFHNRIYHHDWGWAQDPVQSAMLGQTADAKARLLRRYGMKFGKASFPVFWTAGFDWIPDQDNGGVANKTLQSMLIQTHERKIALFPAWPMEWDVAFRVYAPFQTVITGKLEKGSLVELEVVPEERRRDILFCPGGW